MNKLGKIKKALGRIVLGSRMLVRLPELGKHKSYMRFKLPFTKLGA